MRLWLIVHGRTRLWMSDDSQYKVETSPITKKHNTKKRLRWPQTFKFRFLGYPVELPGNERTFTFIWRDNFV